MCCEFWLAGYIEAMHQQNFTWAAGQLLQQRYQLQKKLGHNGEREVWLSQDLQSQPSQPVVVKLLPFHAQTHWDELTLFEREIAVLQSLHHPQVPRYRDSFMLDAPTGISWFVLVEAFISGQSLTQWLQQGRHLTAIQVCTIAAQVLTVLIDLHEHNPPLLHRDIKPSNLILGRDRQIYLIDFGSVQEHSTTDRTSTVVGTSGYAPPEQFFGRAVPESDLYALGATLIHLLTGTSPADLPQQELRIQFRDQVSVPDGLAAWIETLTEPDVADRFRTAREALAALKAIDLTPTVRSRPQPAHSRIQIHTADHKLQITMPGIGLSQRQIAGSLLQFAVLIGVFWAIWSGWWLTHVRLPNAAPEDTAFMIHFIRVLALIPWGMAALTSLKQLLQHWQPTRISFDKTQSKLRLNWLQVGRYRWQQVERLDQIQDISVSTQVRQQETWFTRRPQPSAVLMQIGQHRYIFAAGSTPAECTWLVQEMKHWLKSAR